MKSFARLDTEGHGWRRGIYETEMSGCLWSSNTNIRYRRRRFSQDFTDTQPSTRALYLEEDSKVYKRECEISSEIKSKEEFKTTKPLLSAGLTRRMNLKAKLNVTLASGITVLG